MANNSGFQIFFLVSIKLFHILTLSFFSDLFLLKFQDLLRASLIAQLVKNLPAMQETLVQFLGWEDPLEK